MEKAGPVLSIRSSDIIIMFLMQGWIWGFDSTGIKYSLTGGAAIFVGTMSLGFHKWRMSKRPVDGNLYTPRGMDINQVGLARAKKSGEDGATETLLGDEQEEVELMPPSEISPLEVQLDASLRST